MSLTVIHTTDQILEASTGHQLLLFGFFVVWSEQVSSSDEVSGLTELRKAGICPNCGKRIAKGTAQVRGPGAFCSLDCVASFYSAEFSERARRLASAAAN